MAELLSDEDVMKPKLLSDAEVSAKPELNTETGAPAKVRALVGGAPTPEARLQTIRKFYPDARPASILDDTEGYEDNFVYTDPETGKKTLYNPPGLDWGDVPAVAREGVQMVAGTGGAIAGAPAGPAGVIAGAGVGTAGGEELFNLVAQAFGMEDPRSLGERARDAWLTAGAASTGQAVGMGVGKGVSSTVKSAFRGGAAGRAEVNSAISDLGRFGASPSLAQATRSPAFDALESFISRTPGGSGRIRKAAIETAERVARGMEERAQRLAGRAVEPEIAGRTIIRGISGPGGFVERFQDKAGVLYNELDKFIPADDMVGVANTKTALQNLATKVQGMDEINALLVTPRMAALSEGFSKVNGIPYAVLKQLRSAVGKKLSGGGLIDDVPRGEWKQLYAAISRDMESAARLAGDDAVKAYTRANNFYKAGLARIDDSLEPIVRNKVPEKVFDSLEIGGRKGATNIRTLRKSLEPDQWRVVAATTIRRLGRATPGMQGAEGGEFSFNTFLTNWNRLDKTAKDALFNGPGLRGMRADLDAVARAAERIRESSKAFANPSGTAQGLIGQAMLLGGAAAAMGGAVTGDSKMLAFPAMLALLAVGANASARLMTSRAFVRWLGASTRMKAGGFAAHMGRLATTAKIADPETSQAIRQYLDVFRTVGAGNTQPQAAGQSQGQTGPQAR